MFLSLLARRLHDVRRSELGRDRTHCMMYERLSLVETEHIASRLREVVGIAVSNPGCPVAAFVINVLKVLKQTKSL